jgi:hypothetical protein
MTEFEEKLIWELHRLGDACFAISIKKGEDLFPLIIGLVAGALLTLVSLALQGYR